MTEKISVEREKHVSKFKEKYSVELLESAATYAAMHVKSPLFKGRLNNGLLVRFDWPGVLTVAMPTGEIIIQSEPGKPTTPKATDAA